MENILEINGLSKNYGPLAALKNLNLKIPAGSVYGLLGPNGSGKTTTLGMLLGITKPSGGTFAWFGQNQSFETKRRIGALLETPNFYPYLNARQNLSIVATIKELKNPKIDETLDSVGLLNRANSKFKTYSLGMKQRLAIASALLSEPEVLVLDEPTNGLDPQGIAQIRNLVIEIAQRGITIILASHLLAEVEKVCTHAAVLRTGDLLYSGPVSTIMGSEVKLEIRSSNQSALTDALKTMSEVEEMTMEEDKLLITLAKGATAEGINRDLANRGIYVNHMVSHKSNLETQFLNLLKS